MTSGQSHCTAMQLTVDDSSVTVCITHSTSCAACSAAALLCPRPLQVVTWTAMQSLQLGGHWARQWCMSSCSIMCAQWPRGHHARSWCGSSYSIQHQVWSS